MPTFAPDNLRNVNKPHFDNLGNVKNVRFAILRNVGKYYGTRDEKKNL